jgi:uncharacterized membrane protein YdfJ with MMPL/SSD domain
MTNASDSPLIAALTLLGRFLYRVVLAVVIVWLLGLVVGLFTGDTSGGGVREITP